MSANAAPTSPARNLPARWPLIALLMCCVAYAAAVTVPGGVFFDSTMTAAGAAALLSVGALLAWRGWRPVIFLLMLFFAMIALASLIFAVADGDAAYLATLPPAAAAVALLAGPVVGRTRRT